MDSPFDEDEILDAVYKNKNEISIVLVIEAVLRMYVNKLMELLFIVNSQYQCDGNW